MKQLLAYCLSIILCVSFTGCMENYLDLYPEDKITSASFPENESDIKLLLNGVYAQLREKEVYNQGLFGFGITDGATPNAFNWGTDEEKMLRDNLPGKLFVGLYGFSGFIGRSESQIFR